MQQFLQFLTCFLILSLAVLQTQIPVTVLANVKNPDGTRTEDKLEKDTAVPERKISTALSDRVQRGLGFLEKSDAQLVKVFNKAWQAAGCGELDTERVVLIFLMSNGSYTGKLLPLTNEYAKVTFRWDTRTIAIVHTHPNKDDPEPSKHDEEVAKHFAVPIFTLTRQGMYVYNPATRKSQRLIAGIDWLDPSKWTHQIYASADLGIENKQ